MCVLWGWGEIVGMAAWPGEHTDQGCMVNLLRSNKADYTVCDLYLKFFLSFLCDVTCHLCRVEPKNNGSTI